MFNKLFESKHPQSLIIKYPIWKGMLNFDHSPKGSATAFFFGLIYGWVCNLFLLDIDTFTWQFLIKGISGILFAGISAFFVKIVNTFYEKNIKDRLFKPKKHTKRKVIDDE